MNQRSSIPNPHLLESSFTRTYPSPGLRPARWIRFSTVAAIKIIYSRFIEFETNKCLQQRILMRVHFFKNQSVFVSLINIHPCSLLIYPSPPFLVYKEKQHLPMRFAWKNIFCSSVLRLRAIKVPSSYLL